MSVKKGLWTHHLCCWCVDIRPESPDLHNTMTRYLTSLNTHRGTEGNEPSAQVTWSHHHKQRRMRKVELLPLQQKYEGQTNVMKHRVNTRTVLRPSFIRTPVSSTCVELHSSQLPCHKLSSWYWVTHTHQLFHWFGWNWMISYGGNVFCFSLWWTHELNSSTSELLMEQTLCGVSRSQIGLHVVGTIGSVPAERTTGVNRNMLKSGCWFAAMLRYNHT